jgi:hypothetical protein
LYENENPGGHFCLTSTFGAYAQTSDAEADAIINLLGVQKREAVAKLVSVSGKRLRCLLEII